MKELRYYQIEAKESVYAALARGITRQMVVLPTGAGKTTVAVKTTEPFNRILWVTHSELLIEQSSLAFIRERFDESLAKHIEEVGFINYVRSGGLFAGSDFKMGVIKAADFYPQGNVVVASIQTLHNRLNLLKPDEFDCIVIDECHLAAAISWAKVTDYFNPKLLLGLTATPTRSDGAQLGDIFDEIVYQYDIKQAVDDGFLCELDAIRVKTTTSLDKVRTLGGELNQRDLANEINTPERNLLVVSNYIKYCNGRQAIFYCSDINHAVNLAEVFNDMGVKTKAISSNEELTPNGSENIKLFKAKNLTVLTNCMVLTTGVDIPDVSCIGMATPTKSLTKALQCIGRGTRLKSKEVVDKFGQNCIILDYIDNTSRHNLVNCWELDKDKDPEDRVFISAEKRDKLLEERKRKALLNFERKEDEIVQLLRIPKAKVNKSIRMREEATEKQLLWIKDLGYDIEKDHYTKGMCNQIILNLPATEKQVNMLKAIGYDTKSVNVITRGMVDACMKEYEAKKKVKTKP
nr:DEAD/DEAH box helicase [uncultured Flavobacterium sp.]